MAARRRMPETVSVRLPREADYRARMLAATRNISKPALLAALVDEEWERRMPPGFPGPGQPAPGQPAPAGGGAPKGRRGR